MSTCLMTMFYIVVISLLGAVTSLPTTDHRTCLRALAPPTNSRGVNRLSRKSDLPLFRLKVIPDPKVTGSPNSSQVYTVQMTSEGQQQAFSDVKISLQTHGQCGTGNLTFDPRAFLVAERNDPDCPLLLLTNQKSTKLELPPLQWIPPACGCVEFRALVVEDGRVYYTDSSEETDGPLTQTVCVEEKVTRERYLAALCQVNERYSSAEILSRKTFLTRHQLETRWMDRHGLEMAMELRRADNRLCCTQTSLESQLACFDDTRRRRVDRFCEDGYPDIPFTDFRLKHMRNREKSCCFLLGEHRYSCFAEGSSPFNGTAGSELDFSKDETDPVNDLAEMATIQDTDILQWIRSASSLRQKEAAKTDKTNKDTEKAEEKKEDGAKDMTVETSRGSAVTVSAGKRSRPKVTRGEPAQRKAKASANRKMAKPGGIPVVGARQSATRSQTNAEKRVMRKGGVIHRDRSSERRRTAGQEIIGGAGRPAALSVSSRRRASTERIPAPSSQKEWTSGLDKDGPSLAHERDMMPSIPARLTSAERRARKMTSAQRRFDWPDTVDEPNFDDQGGASVAETLNKLERKMKRLRLKQQCCEHGALFGPRVSGNFRSAWTQCEHGASKFLSRMDVLYGKRACEEQFHKCCLEQSASGPPLTSSEFRDARFMYRHNMGTLDPSRDLPAVAPGNLQRPHVSANEGLMRGGVGRDLPSRETPEAYELDSDQMFESMRSVDTRKYNEDDDEYDGPRQFDETDNERDESDVLHRKEVTAYKKLPQVEPEDDEDFDDRDFTGNDDEDEDDDFAILGISSMDRTSTRNKQHVSSRHHTGPRRHLKRINRREEVSLDRNSQSTTSPDKATEFEKSYLSVGQSHNSRYTRTSRRGGRSKSRGHRSRQSRRRTSRRRTSRRRSGERRHSGMFRPMYPVRNPFKSHGKLGALDSQEMAAAHTRTLTGTLDSREMAAAYRKTDPVMRGYLSDALVNRKSARKGRRHHRRGPGFYA